MIPPAADAEFVAGMEEVLDTYAAGYDPRHPVLCMDEQPVQLLKETRAPIPATKGRPRRVDYEYERAGTASLFLFCDRSSRAGKPNRRAALRYLDYLRGASGRPPVCVQHILGEHALRVEERPVQGDGGPHRGPEV